VLLRSDGSPILIDFGAARAEVAEQSQTMTVVLTPGFAPYEQYFRSGKTQGPWVDVYGAAATLYFALTGQAPPTAIERHDATTHGKPDPLAPPERLAPGIPPRIREVLTRGLAIDYRLRPQNANQYLSLLKKAAATKTGEEPRPAPPLEHRHEPQPTPRHDPPPNRRPGPLRMVLLTSAVLGGLGALAFFLWPRGPSCADATPRWAAIAPSVRAADYEAFLKDFSLCEQAPQARVRRDEIVAWEALDKTSLKNLRLFLKEHPDGLFAESAARLAGEAARTLAEAEQARAAQAMTAVPLDRMGTQAYQQASQAFARAQGLLETGQVEEAGRQFGEARRQFERLRGS